MHNTLQYALISSKTLILACLTLVPYVQTFWHHIQICIAILNYKIQYKDSSIHFFPPFNWQDNISLTINKIFVSLTKLKMCFEFTIINWLSSIPWPSYKTIIVYESIRLSADTHDMCNNKTQKPYVVSRYFFYEVSTGKNIKNLFYYFRSKTCHIYI